MVEIALLTPHDIDSQTESAWLERLDGLIAPLRARGLSVTHLPWTTEQELRHFAVVLPLLAWGYHRDGERWLSQLERWTQSGVALRNSAAVLQANSDKRYLAQLERLGVAIAPSVFTKAPDSALLQDCLTRWQCEELVIKPTISAGAFHTLRLTRAAIASFQAPALSCEWIVQPFLPAIADAGEWSLIYFNKRFSHAVCKMPCKGEFRVQEGFGGTTRAESPHPALLACAEAALAAMPDLLYARVDLTHYQDQVVLMELEAIEPDLFLKFDPGAATRFAEAVWDSAHANP
jgi:glutathione synthase/RimK-type ligase-like ATP-grasp enzyme